LANLRSAYPPSTCHRRTRWLGRMESFRIATLMENIERLQLQIIKAIVAETDEKTLLAILGMLNDPSAQADRAVAEALKAGEGRVLLAVRILRNSVTGMSLKDARDAIVGHPRYTELKGT